MKTATRKIPKWFHEWFMRYGLDRHTQINMDTWMVNRAKECAWRAYNKGLRMRQDTASAQEKIITKLQQTIQSLRA